MIDIYSDVFAVLREPQWRSDLVLEMVREGRRVFRSARRDYHLLCAYRKLLLSLDSSDGCLKYQHVLRGEQRAIYQAHEWHCSSDDATRQAIEAWLLTGEPFADIAEKFAADPQAIKFYAKLFFDVRNYLQGKDWIWITIGRRVEYDRRRGCSWADARRGYAMRYFAYYGGASVLTLLINSIGAAAKSGEDILGRGGEGLHNPDIVLAAAAAATLDFDDVPHTEIIKLAQRLKAKRVDRVDDMDESKLEEICEAIREWPYTGEQTQDTGVST